MNVKKGCLAILELNFNERQSLDRHVSLSQSDSKPQLYRVIEVSLGHVCEWSVNVKKGCLAILELNFNERQSLDRHVSLSQSDSKPQLYRVIEVR